MKNPRLSPATFIAITPLHPKPRSRKRKTVISEMLMQREPASAKDIKVEKLQGRFNDMYYLFISKLPVFSAYHKYLPESDTRNMVILFQELADLQKTLEKEST
jgi:hypothetical protein